MLWRRLPDVVQSAVGLPAITRSLVLVHWFPATRWHAYLSNAHNLLLKINAEPQCEREYGSSLTTSVEIRQWGSEYESLAMTGLSQRTLRRAMRRCIRRR